MKTRPLTITQQSWSLRSALILVLCVAVVPHIVRANDWMQQQQRNAQAAAYQQQQQVYEQQRRQQEAERQQRSQQETQRTYEYQRQQQDQRQKTIEENYRQQSARYAAEEEERRTRLQRQQSWDTPYYYQNSAAASGEASSDTQPTATPNTTTESYASSDAQLPLVDVRQPTNSYAAMLFWFIGGAFLTAVALQRKSFAVIAARQLPGCARYQMKQWFLIAGHHGGSRILATELRIKRSFRFIVFAAKHQLLRLIPPRWLVLRVGSLAIGIAIILASGIAFVDLQIVTGFMAMTIGYAIAAATWLVPWLLSRNPAQKLDRYSADPHAQYIGSKFRAFRLGYAPDFDHWLRRTTDRDMDRCKRVKSAL